VNLVTLAFRNLRRRTVRSTIVAFSVGLAVASALTLVALSDSIEASVHQSVDERGADLTVMQRDASDIFSGFIPEGLEGRLAAVPGVAGVAGEMIGYAPIDHSQQRLVLGWSADSFFWRQMPIKDGRLPANGERKIAVLGAGAADALNKKVGDSLDILDEKFQVVAIAGYVSALNRSVIIVPLHDLQELLFKSDQVTMFHLKLADKVTPQDVTRIGTDVAALGSLEVAPTDGTLSHDRNLAILKAISRAISMIAVTMAGLSVLSALLMAVQERTREIGVMMAIGWDKRHTMASIVIEGVLIGIAGCLIGVVLGYIASFSFSSLPAIGDLLNFRPTVSTILPTILAALVLCALGSLYPAWRAVSLAPAEAIRAA